MSTQPDFFFLKYRKFPIGLWKLPLKLLNSIADGWFKQGLPFIFSNNPRSCVLFHLTDYNKGKWPSKPAHMMLWGEDLNPDVSDSKDVFFL